MFPIEASEWADEGVELQPINDSLGVRIGNGAELLKFGYIIWRGAGDVEERVIIKLIFFFSFSFFYVSSFSLLSFSHPLLSPASSLLLSQNPEGLTLPGDADADQADRADERIEHRQELRVLRAARRQPLQARARARVRRSQAGAEMTVEVWFTLLMNTTIERKVKFEVLGMRNITKRTACAIPSLFPTSSPSH